MSTLILSNYRCGTTFYGKNYAEENNLVFLDEMFHESFNKKQLQTQWRRFNQEKCVAKIFPTHVLPEYEYTQVEYHKLLKPEKVIIIRRENVLEQVKSFIVAKKLQEECNINWHEQYKDLKTIKVSHHYFEFWFQRIVKQNQQIQELADFFKVPTETVWYESFATKRHRYKRPVELIVFN